MRLRIYLGEVIVLIAFHLRHQLGKVLLHIWILNRARAQKWLSYELIDF